MEEVGRFLLALDHGIAVTAAETTVTGTRLRDGTRAYDRV
jgi:hypothetical protein